MEIRVIHFLRHKDWRAAEKTLRVFTKNRGKSIDGILTDMMLFTKNRFYSTRKQEKAKFLLEYFVKRNEE